MHPFPALVSQLVQYVRALIASAAPALAAPARPIYRGAQDGWVMPPNAHLPRLPGPVWTLLWFRLHRLANRLTTLHHRWQTNTLPKPRTRPKTPRKTPTNPQAQIPTFPMPGVPLTDAPRYLPRAQGWVIKRIPEAGEQAAHLHHLLQQPDTQKFVEAAPQAARLLRPLCRALGVDQPAWLKLPPRPRRPAKPSPPKPRRWKLTDPELKLRPYEIRAIRYWRKKYGTD
jgi:hypothetical protein